MSTSHDPAYDNRDPLYDNSNFAGSTAELNLATILDELEGAGDEFARTYIHDEHARKMYKAKIREFAEEIFDLVSKGYMSPADGAEQAVKQRNTMLALAREKSSILGRSKAEFIKAHGAKLDDLAKKYSREMYGKTVEQLAGWERDSVHLEIIRASGRSNASVNSRVSKLGVLGRSIWAYSLFESGKNLLNSKNKKEALVHEITIHLSSFVGGFAGAFAVTAIFSTAGPIAIGAGMLLGSYFAPEAAHNYMKDHYNHKDE